MQTMRAFRLMEWQRAGFDEVPVPDPGPNDVRVRVAAVGLCHTDLHFREAPAGIFPYSLPFTLGHETTGWVDDVGEAVDGFASGDAVAVVGISSCGRCWYCQRGFDNVCDRAASGRGFGKDGGLASYVVVPARELVPLRGLDPRRAAPLTDAGATSYHVVRKAVPKLTAGTTAVVIGAGGLGGYGIQFLRLLTSAHVIAIDIAEHRLDFARELGAHEALISEPSAADAVRSMTAGDGAAAVFDFVGAQSTVDIAMRCARRLGSVTLVGAAGGTASVGWGMLPPECDVSFSMGATIADLRDVVALAETGDLRSEIEVMPFAETAAAYERFKTGEPQGRVVVALDA
jgi:propanol-preferring alcohol dehydrogenase